jgi:antagonist of KipI
MGYRLVGAKIADAPSGELISTAVPTGAIQVPPTGEPILLMNDHATTGGYAIAGTVITADLPLAGQLAPGDWIEFEACSIETANAELRRREIALDAA